MASVSPLTLAQVSFVTSQTMPVCGYPANLAAGDFDRDGKLDIALACNLGSVKYVSVLIGNGNGTFQTPVHVATANTPYAVTTTDFRGVGKLDLIVTHPSTNEVSVMLGNGDGTFHPPDTYATGAAYSAPFSITLGDFARVGNQSIAVANTGGGAGTSVLLGNGDGTLSTFDSYPVSAGSSLVDIVNGDFNRDGILDLSLTDQLGSRVLTLS